MIGTDEGSHRIVDGDQGFTSIGKLLDAVPYGMEPFVPAGHDIRRVPQGVFRCDPFPIPDRIRMKDEKDPVPIEGFFESPEGVDEKGFPPELLILFRKAPPESLAFSTGDYEGVTFQGP